MALCAMKCIDLTNDIINKKLAQEKNFLNHFVKIRSILKLQKLKDLTIEGRIVVFKPSSILKLIYLALVTEIPTSTINLLTKMQIEFIWKGKNPKTKNNTLCNDYENGGLKNVDFLYNCKLTLLLDKKAIQ